MAVFKYVMALNICLKVRRTKLKDTFVAKPNYVLLEHTTSQGLLQLLFWENKIHCLTVTATANLNWYVFAQGYRHQTNNRRAFK